MKEIPGEKLVFLDESGVNTNLIRRYGRSVGKTRVVDHAPFSTPKSTTVLSAIRQDGQFACMTFEGGTTKERFKEYLARQKILCKSRQAVVKETGANQRISLAGHNPA